MTDRRPLAVGAYYLHELAARALVAGRSPDPTLDAFFDVVRRAGVGAVRTLATHVGPGPTAIQPDAASVSELGLCALDHVIACAHRAGVGLHLSLGNAWNDYGGARAIVGLAGLSRPVTDDGRFYVHPAARAVYRAGMRAVLTRRSSIDGHVLGAHPAVHGLEPLNEPRGAGLDRVGRALTTWLSAVTAEIAVLAPAKSISTGEEGFDVDLSGRDAAYWRSIGCTMPFRHRQSFRRNVRLPQVTHASVHVYPDTWRIEARYHGEAGERFIRESARLARGRPLFVGEMGARGPERWSLLSRWARATWDVGGLPAPWMLASPDMPEHRDEYAIEPEELVAWAREVRR